MKKIDVIISTTTKSGTKRQKVSLTKSTKGVFVNGIIIPKQQYVGELTVAQLSYVACNKDKAEKRAEEWLAKLQRTEIAKKRENPPKVKRTKSKTKSKTKSRRAPKVKRAPRKKAPKVTRLPKAEWFLKSLEENIGLKDHDKVTYYINKLVGMIQADELSKAEFIRAEKLANKVAETLKSVKKS